MMSYHIVAKLANAMGLNTNPHPFVIEGNLSTEATADYRVGVGPDTARTWDVITVEVVDIETDRDQEIISVTVRATDTTGRGDIATGAAAIAEPITTQAIATARLKALALAKVRVLASISGFAAPLTIDYAGWA
jgi:hypothetical protein